MNIESKDVSRRWLTASALLCEKRCELIYADALVATGTDTVSFYDGENTTGELLGILKSAVVTNLELRPPVPIPCDRGLYVSISGSITGVLVVWRVL